MAICMVKTEVPIYLNKQQKDLYENEKSNQV